MNFADTSLLCALYRPQDNSADADRLMRQEAAPVYISALVLFEFRQSARLQAYRYSKDRLQGFPKREARRMLETLQANISKGRLVISPVADWAKVHGTAEHLSAQYTIAGGYRSFDVLHVATALELKADIFFTFDSRQGALAKSAGLKVKP
jgi:predicted nucleic acid-binding protein